MSETCTLREANEIIGEDCNEEGCIFWRAVSHLGEEEGQGCAIQHFQLLGEDEVVKWLLSVKERIERMDVKV
jgi:hypothetical protein